MMDTPATRSPSFEPWEIYAQAMLPFALDAKPSYFKLATAVLLNPTDVEVQKRYATYIQSNFHGLIKHYSAVKSPQEVPRVEVYPRRSCRSTAFSSSWTICAELVQSEFPQEPFLTALYLMILTLEWA